MEDQTVRFFAIPDIEQARSRLGSSYLEFWRAPSMSAGLYHLPAGGADLQSSHRQDEVYYVIGGRARMRAAGQDQPVREGSVIFVAAQQEHRFYDIEEELTLLVLFAPPESE